MKKLKLFHLNDYSVKANNLQEAIHIVERISPTWKYRFCSRVDEI